MTTVTAIANIVTLRIASLYRSDSVRSLRKPRRAQRARGRSRARGRRPRRLRAAELVVAAVLEAPSGKERARTPPLRAAPRRSARLDRRVGLELLADPVAERIELRRRRRARIPRRR